MLTRSLAKLRATQTLPRVETMDGTESELVTHDSSPVKSPSSAAGHIRGGRSSSRSSSSEAGPRRTCRTIPRSESAGGAKGSDREIAPLFEPVSAVADEPGFCHTQDKGSNFTRCLGITGIGQWRSYVDSAERRQIITLSTELYTIIFC